MTNRIEKRAAQIRAAQGEEFVLSGRALSYNEVSSNELYPGCREQIAPGCFRAAIASNADDVYALYNHQETGSAIPLGRLSAGTLVIQDSDTALNFRVLLDKNNSQHRDIYSAVKRGDLSECSFGFIAQDESIDNGSYQGQPCQVRTVKQARLSDLSIVVRPFYGNNATAVQARFTNDAAGDAARRLKAQQLEADFQRSERAHAVGMTILNDRLKESRGNQDFLSMRCAEAMRDLKPPLDYCCHDNDYAYGADPDDADDSRCMRFAYEVDPDTGELTLDEDTRCECQHEITHSLRETKRQRRADAELRTRMRAEAGITAR